MPRTVFKTEDDVDFQSEEDAKLHETVARRMGSQKKDYLEVVKRGHVRRYLQGEPGSIIQEGTWLIRGFRSWEDSKKDDLKNYPPVIQIMSGRLIDVMVAVARQGMLAFGGDFQRYDVPSVQAWEDVLKDR